MKANADRKNQTGEKSASDRGKSVAELRENDYGLSFSRALGNQGLRRLLGANRKSLPPVSDGVETSQFSNAAHRKSFGANASLTLQAKLNVNAPGDSFEQEADRIADRVMNTSDAQVQRSCSCTTGGCATCGSKGSVRDLVQTKHVQPSGNGRTAAPPIVNDVLRSPGQPLDRSTREFMDRRFGHNFSQVRLHTDETAADAARAIHANAFTVGSHIVFGEGQFAPDTSKGRHLLAHELTHSVQQAGSEPGMGAAGHVQRDDTEKEVKAVVSPNVTLREGAVTSAESQLTARLKKREADIQGLIAEMGPNPKSDKSKERLKALKKDLAKDLETIIKEPDMKSVHPGLRTDIINSAKSVDAQKLKLKTAKDQWSKYDSIFAGKEVATALGKQTITAAELKALVAQESGDLTKSDTKGDIAGIAQLGTQEEKLAGAKPGDRKKPEKALVIAATIISNYAGQLDKQLSVKPQGLERKKFIMAAYNSGVNAIVTAQREAIKMKRDGKTWQSLIEGGDKSPLYKAIVATYSKRDYAVTYKEKSEYPIKILSRLP